jgi:ribulose-phosphate 3-epimerase
MSIGHIGFQGQAFDPKVIEKIKEVKEKYPSMIISIDGGVSLDIAKTLINAGANRLVIGSAIFGAEDVGEAISKFIEL